MTSERIAILESMSWWEWVASWISKFAKVKKQVRKYDETPPVSHPTLGDWINNQRIAYKVWQARLCGVIDRHRSGKCYMDQERAVKLESLEPWSWEPFKDAWQVKYQKLG